MTRLRVDKQECRITLGETATFTLTVDENEAFPAHELRVTSVNSRFNEQWVHIVAGTGAQDGTQKYKVLIRPEKARLHPFGKYPLQFSRLAANGNSVTALSNCVLLVKPEVSVQGAPRLDMSARRALSIAVPLENASSCDLAMAMKLTHRRTGREEAWTFDLDAGPEAFTLVHELTELRGQVKGPDRFDLEISAEGVPVLDQPIELMPGWSPATKLVSGIAGIALLGGAAGLALVLSNGSSSPKVESPQAPTGLSASAGANQVNLSWAAPSSKGGAPLSGYDIYEGTVQGGSASLVGTSPPEGNSYTVTGLHPGTSYWFYVTARNQAGVSQHSNDVTATTRPMLTTPGPQGRVVTEPPAAPTGLSANAGVDQVNLSWAAPGSNGGAPLSEYDIYEATVPDGLATLAGTSEPHGTSYMVRGLHPGTSYWFYVTARNSAGPSQRSNEVSTTTEVSPAQRSTTVTTTTQHVAPLEPPSVPTGLTASASVDRVTLSWAAPSSASKPPLSGYHVYEAAAAGATASLAGTAPAQATSYTIVGLHPGTT
ncbi:MAG TPA: fibronectin type III domain-containing protein, partial [Acidimicrobiales bacterium]|nr:fibronectin type III domain-containing protein [Acidimicrobiales bacterium]